MQGHRLPATLEVTGSNPGPGKINSIEKKPSTGFLTLNKSTSIRGKKDFWVSIKSIIIIILQKKSLKACQNQGEKFKVKKMIICTNSAQNLMKKMSILTPKLVNFLWRELTTYSLKKNSFTEQKMFGIQNKKFLHHFFEKIYFLKK